MIDELLRIIWSVSQMQHQNYNLDHHVGFALQLGTCTLLSVLPSGFTKFYLKVIKSFSALLIYVDPSLDRAIFGVK